MTYFCIYPMSYFHFAKIVCSMEKASSLIDHLVREKYIIVRSREQLSWGSWEHCEQLFREIFCRVDFSARPYQHLPEYAEVIDWMTATNGLGLLLYGNCGRGKSIILTGVVPVLLRMLNKGTYPIHADEFSLRYPFASSTEGCDPRMTNLEYLIHRSSYPIIDELGTETLINEYGEKYEGFNRIINAAERDLRPLFVSTNLSRDEIYRRYGERTFDRLMHLCRIVEFRGDSLR